MGGVGSGVRTKTQEFSVAGSPFLTFGPHHSDPVHVSSWKEKAGRGRRLGP